MHAKGAEESGIALLTNCNISGFPWLLLRKASRGLSGPWEESAKAIHSACSSNTQKLVEEYIKAQQRPVKTQPSR